MILLSICIPTYNFGDYIGDTLDSFLNQVTDEIEVLVFDGGSDDATENIVLSRQELITNLRYHKQDYRGGVDRDIDSAVHLARGRYCWLVSADDIVLPGAINKILTEVRRDHDIYICEHSNYKKNVEDAIPYPIFKEFTGPKLYNTNMNSELEKYFKSAVTSEAYLTFLSTPIFKRELWINTQVSDDIYGTCWIVAGRLLPVMRDGALVYYTNLVLLSKRMQNISHIFSGMVSQFRIMMINLPKVVRIYFPLNSVGELELRRILRSEISLVFLLRAKLAARNSESTMSLILTSVNYIYTHGNIRDYSKRFLVFYTPCLILIFFEKFIQLFKKLRI